MSEKERKYLVFVRKNIPCLTREPCFKAHPAGKETQTHDDDKDDKKKKRKQQKAKLDKI